MPVAYHKQVMEDCPGCLLSAYLIAAQALLYTNKAAAEGLKDAVAASLEVMKHPMKKVLGEGWGISRGLEQFMTIYHSLPPLPNPKYLDIVISRCKEDLAWILELLEELDGCSGLVKCRIIIAEKCGQIIDKDLADKIPVEVLCLVLPNRGMESLAYSMYMIKTFNQTDPPSYSLFLHGKPFDHASKG